ncbi:hypothetical protein C8R44DRAFT_744956 [Mycena epipterygia]|nr:hypothetical protein C8R44DRAFT_744956 [Mycena epipterygia]
MLDHYGNRCQGETGPRIIGFGAPLEAQNRPKSSGFASGILGYYPGSWRNLLMYETDVNYSTRVTVPALSSRQGATKLSSSDIKDNVSLLNPVDSAGQIKWSRLRS